MSKFALFTPTPPYSPYPYATHYKYGMRVVSHDRTPYNHGLVSFSSSPLTEVVLLACVGWDNIHLLWSKGCYCRNGRFSGIQQHIYQACHQSNKVIAASQSRQMMGNHLFRCWNYSHVVTSETVKGSSLPSRLIAYLLQYLRLTLTILP